MLQALQDMHNKVLSLFILAVLILSFSVYAAGLDGFSGVTEVTKVTSSHANYKEISEQYPQSDLYEVKYHIHEGWNFLPYSILNGRDSVTGKSTCWKQDDQRGNIQATVLDYVYIYEPDASTLPEQRVGDYVGGSVEDWSNSPLNRYQQSIWSIPEPNKKMTLPVNWVYSSQDCDFVFYTYWLQEDNLKETTDALKGGNIPCTSDYCPLKLEEGWQVVLQLFPGFTWDEIKGDCVIEEINFWNSESQVYTVGPQEKEENLKIFMSTLIEKEDYFKPIMMKLQNDCTLEYKQ